MARASRLAPRLARSAAAFAALAGIGVCWPGADGPGPGAPEAGCGAELQDGMPVAYDAEVQGLLQVNAAVSRDGKQRSAVSRGGVRYQQELHNVRNTEYVGAFRLGGEPLRGVFDTGSFEVVAFSQSCLTCGLAGAMGYSSELSPTYRAGPLAKAIKYGSGTVFATSATDTMEVGPSKVQSQSFWKAWHAKVPILKNAQFQAIIGLGPPGEPQKEVAEQLQQDDSRNERKIFDLTVNMTDSLLMNLGVRYFSECLRRESDAPGVLVWNDPPNPAEFTEIKVAGKITWGVELSNVRFKGSDSAAVDIACQRGCGAILDTGTSLIAVPSVVYERIFNLVNGLTAAGISCDRFDLLPNLEFELGGKLHVLPPEAYIGVSTVEINTVLRTSLSLPPFQMKECELLLMSNGDTQTPFGPLWIIGLPFFRHYYTTFDLGPHPESSAGRRIWTAPASEDCHSTTGPSGQQHLNGTSLVARGNRTGRHLLKVDGSRLRAPAWLERLAKLPAPKVML